MSHSKKSIRFITVILLVLAMVFSTAITASAAGVETWWGSTVTENTFTINGYNLSPVKTMGTSGTLIIGCTFKARRDLDGNSSSDIEYYTLEIRNTSGTVLARGTANDSQSSLMGCYVQLQVPVVAGQKIQVYTSAYCSHGNACKCDITYSHTIS